VGLGLTGAVGFIGIIFETLWMTSLEVGAIHKARIYAERMVLCYLLSLLLTAIFK
jgi:hypothetical protein